MNPLLRLGGIRVEVAGGATLLEVDELSVQRGETLVVMGATGAGKSTLLRVINGLMAPSRGQSWWDGQQLAWPLPLGIRRKMSMAFQDPLLFRGSVADNVAYGLRVRGEGKAEVARRVRKALEIFSVAHLEDRPCTRLSGGEAHRVSLARAIVVRPELLLLDEPLAAVDAVTRERLEAELRAVLRAEGMACVYVTHHQREAQRMADRIAVLDHGRLLQVGTPDEIFYRPSNERVAKFVQAGNLLRGVVRRAVAGQVEIEVEGRTIEAVSELAVGSAVIVCLRAEDIAIARAAGQQAPERPDAVSNRVQCTVSSMQPQGPITQLTLECGMRLVAVITRRAAQDLGLEVGDVVEASFQATALHILQQTEVPADAASERSSPNHS